MKPTALPPVPGDPAVAAPLVFTLSLFELQAAARSVEARATTVRARRIRMFPPGVLVGVWWSVLVLFGAARRPCGQAVVVMSLASCRCGHFEAPPKALGCFIEPAPRQQHQHDDGGDIGDGVERELVDPVPSGLQGG